MENDERKKNCINEIYWKKFFGKEQKIIINFVFWKNSLSCRQRFWFSTFFFIWKQPEKIPISLFPPKKHTKDVSLLPKWINYFILLFNLKWNKVLLGFWCLFNFLITKKNWIKFFSSNRRIDEIISFFFATKIEIERSFVVIVVEPNRNYSTKTTSSLNIKKKIFQVF